MPRISAEARGVSAFQPNAKPHMAPKTLTPDERKVWYDIVNSKPHDWFDAGSLILLERYCVLAVDAREMTAQMRAAPNASLRSIIRKELVHTTVAIGNIATRCRLSVQAAIDRRSMVLDEKGAGDDEDDGLLGGGGKAWREAKKSSMIQ